MSTKTNLEYTSNSYSGGIMGSDSPAALLDMLAEVASQTLHSEKKRTKSLLASQCKPKTDFSKKKAQELCFSVPQLLSMPASQLVKQFSIFTSDELKRQYSYTCELVIGCGQKYTSFASEGRARMSIKAHLAEHLEYLKTNKEAYNSFVARPVNYKNCKPSPQNKKSRLQQSKKPQETLNKENKNVILEKSTNYLRNILLNDVSFKEVDKHKSLEKTDSSKKLCNSEQGDTDRIDFKVLGDHSYFERLKDEMPNGKEASPLDNVLDNATTDENIVFMVVGTDSVHMKEYTHINQELSENINQDSEAVYLPEIPWSDDNCNTKMEITTTTKPKGKAKFIGTSKEEREMALAFMDRIKKKGNPTGSNLECRICNPPRSFTAPTTLVSHYRSHAGIKPYECRICRAVFTRRHSLKYHMLIHQNQTRFTCADCGKKFRHPSHFREHRRRHTGEAPFGCDDCGQRFKTRNTYKRHLKTRHGKVLTTTGELLYLSEEDFQKVRTNRKKKIDYNKDSLVDEDVIASKAIMNCEDDNDHQEITANGSEEYVVNEDTDDGGRNWEPKGTIQIIKKSFDTYEVCPDPRLNKTENMETEIPIESRVSDRNGNNIQDEYADKVQDNLPELQSASYNHLEIVHDEQSQIVCHENIEDRSELIYDSANEAPSYIKVEYNSGVNGADGNNVVEYQENIDFLENQIKSHVQVIQQSEEDYCESMLNSELEKRQAEYLDGVEETQISVELRTHNKKHDKNYNKQIIITRGAVDYEEANEHNDQEQESHEIVLSMDSESLAEEESILQTVNQITSRGLSRSEDSSQDEGEIRSFKRSKGLSNYQSVVEDLINDRTIVSTRSSSENNSKRSSHQTNQHLYVHTEPLTGIIVQNKCVNILPRQFNTPHEQWDKSKAQSNKDRKFTLLNKQAQAITVKQSGKQSAILLLTNDTLKNGIFRIDQNGTAINGVKKQVLDRSK